MMNYITRMFLFLALGSPLVFAEDTTTKAIQPLDIFELEWALDPQLSPSGDRILYVRQRADIMSDQRYSALWLISVDGNIHRPVTVGKRNDSSPRWSPDGERIAYVAASDEGRPEIRVRWLESGNETVAALPENPSRLAWSPDGEQLAFVMFKPEKPPQIAKMPTPPEGAEWAEPAYVTESFVYRYVGRDFVEPGALHLYTMPAEGGSLRDLGQVSPQVTPPGLSWAPVHLDWAPSGESIIFSALRRGVDFRKPQETELYEITIADGEIIALTSRDGPDNNPKVSPDGRYVAFTGFTDRYQSYQTTHLYVMNREGGEITLLTERLDRDIADMEWDEDSDGLFIMYGDEGMTTLAHIDLEGGLEVMTTGIGSNATASTAGGSFTVSTGGRFAFPAAGADYTGEIATGRYQREDVRRLTSFNEGVLANRTLGQLEEISFNSSKDGLPIQGWLLYPPGFDANKKYPLIVELHGAPTNYGPRFDFEKQLMAADGYIVLYINYRGSTSYGEEFANIVDDNYPGDEPFDILSGVDAAIAKGNVDEDRLYLTGGSGGGVLSAWTVSHTDRFRAAASLYPIIDFSSWVLTTDMAADGMTYWLPGAPWEAPEAYFARSPLMPVANVTTPTILIVGTNDYRTPESQAEHFYRALMWEGVDTMLVRVPDEGHGITRHPSHHLSKVLHILGWFEKHR